MHIKISAVEVTQNNNFCVLLIWTMLASLSSRSHHVCGVFPGNSRKRNDSWFWIRHLLFCPFYPECHLRLRSLGTADRPLLSLGLDAALSWPKLPLQAQPPRGGLVGDLGKMGAAAALCPLHLPLPLHLHLLLLLPPNQGRSKYVFLWASLELKQWAGLMVAMDTSSVELV